jgi:riboflavin synthase
MFTGIIEATGEILRIESQRGGRQLVLSVPAGLTDLQLGDSINVNGVCLTVTEKGGGRITVDVSSETLARTTFSEARPGDTVNLERALRLSDRLGGHLVTGHVDGIGTLLEERKEREFIHLKIRIPQGIERYIVQKGSIAIDGTSLTVNECQGDTIHLTLIPYTLEKTILMDKRIGARVNVETDILGKYVEKMVARGPEKVGLSFLKEHGFIKD